MTNRNSADRLGLWFVSLITLAGQSGCGDNESKNLRSDGQAETQESGTQQSSFGLNAITVSSVTPAVTDFNIQFENLNRHYYGGCEKGSCDKGKLFVFFPGTAASASSYQWILKVMAEQGVAVIGLNYENDTSVETECGLLGSCFGNVRSARFLGGNFSPFVTSTSDGVENRLKKLLKHLGWTNFYTPATDTIAWSKIVLGGHSQGAGMAAYISKSMNVNRVCQFSGTWDQVNNTPVAWLSQASTTSATKLFGFAHRDDVETNGIIKLNANWKSLGMGVSATPLPLWTAPSGQKIHTTDNDCGSFLTRHSCSVVDSVTPMNANGRPRYESAWRYTCLGMN